MWIFWSLWLPDSGALDLQQQIEKSYNQWFITAVSRGTLDLLESDTSSWHVGSPCQQLYPWP